VELARGDLARSRAPLQQRGGGDWLRSSLNNNEMVPRPLAGAAAGYRQPRVIRAQPGNIPLSDSDQEDWC